MTVLLGALGCTFCIFLYCQGGARVGNCTARTVQKRRVAAPAMIANASIFSFFMAVFHGLDRDSTSVSSDRIARNRTLLGPYVSLTPGLARKPHCFALKRSGTSERQAEAEVERDSEVSSMEQ